MRDRVIVFFSDMRWDGLTQRQQHMCDRLSMTTPVIYCYPDTRMPMDLWQRDFIARFVSGLPLFSVPQGIKRRGLRWLAPVFRKLSESRALNGALKWLNVRRLRKACREYNEVWIVVGGVKLAGSAMAFYQRLREAGVPAVLHADIADDVGVAKASRLLTREHYLCSLRADSSSITHPGLGLLFPINPVLIPNGFDPRHFMVYPAKLDIGKRVEAIYVGSMEYLDWNFLWNVLYYIRARGIAYPPPAGRDFRLRFVGPETDDLKWLAESFPAQVEVVGRKPQRECARMISESHVGIIPFRRRPETRVVDACKYYEYISGATPVVATGYQNQPYPYMLQANGHMQFAGALLDPPTLDAKECRREMAECTWGRRATQLYLTLAKAAEDNERTRLMEEHP